MVLQREPSSAAVYGEFETTSSDPLNNAMSVNVTVSGAANVSSIKLVSYTVEAAISFEESLFDEDGGNQTNIFKFKALLLPMAAGGTYEILAECNADQSHGNESSSVTLYDVTFGDVWYCGGQSNMAIALEYTYMRNESQKAIVQGKYRNIRLFSLKTNMNPYQEWTRAEHAMLLKRTFLQFSSTCWYFAESLTDELAQTEDDSIPIGLVHTSYGGTTIEDWIDDKTLTSCENPCDRNTNDGIGLYNDFVKPFVDMSVKGWIWYQGENNIVNRNCLHGNVLRNSGYACYAAALVRSWRAIWSLTPGTTDPLAPFGVVALPESGGMGRSGIGTMRWAQTAGYGTLPNPAMPNTFLVQSYDQDDPYESLWNTCWASGCCYPQDLVRHSVQAKCSNWNASSGSCGEYCDARCGGFCANLSATNAFIGLIHPRSKKEIGSRLARGAAASGYGIDFLPATGPTLAGCRIGPANSKSLTLVFNSTILAGDTVKVQPYNRSASGLSKVEVLVDPSLFCMQTVGSFCVDDGDGNYYAKSDDEHEGWVAVDFANEGGFGYNTVVIDLNKTGGVAHAIRYVWHGTCCNGGPDPDDMSTDHCPLGSCPIIGRVSGLPANPFISKIVDGKCSCIPPQACDEDPFASTNEMEDSTAGSEVEDGTAGSEVEDNTAGSEVEDSVVESDSVEEEENAPPPETSETPNEDIEGDVEKAQSKVTVPLNVWAGSGVVIASVLLSLAALCLVRQRRVVQSFPDYHSDAKEDISSDVYLSKRSDESV